MSALKKTFSKDAIRSEKEIFSELSVLCASPGFIHVIAYLSWRDNIFKFSDDLEVEDVVSQPLSESLCRNEISTLIGLTLRQEIDFTLPKPEVMQSMIDEADALFNELHNSMSLGAMSELDFSRVQEEGFNPFADASMIREPIFYCGDSAYIFQYLDFSEAKYSKDNTWLVENKGYSAQCAKAVIDSMIEIRADKIMSLSESLMQTIPDEWTVLPAFVLTIEEVCDRTHQSKEVVESVMNSFAISLDSRSEEFSSLSNFNIANAYPLINLDENEYLLLQQYNLAEAFYETPFFWFMGDKSYKAEAINHRGEFTE
mgnify:CR=1 FL=1